MNDTISHEENKSDDMIVDEEKEVDRLLRIIPSCNIEEAIKIIQVRRKLIEYDHHNSEDNGNNSNSSSSSNSSIIKNSFSNYSEMTILRFIRGRRGDIDKGYRALIRNRNWREEYVSTLNPDDFIEEAATEKLFTKGYDSVGRPILHVIAERHDKYERDINALKQYLIYTMEEIVKRTKPEEEKITILFDLQGFSLNCMDYEAVQMLVQTLQFNYPEILSVAYILNAPFIFSACWLIIKPWLDPVTAAKVVFITSTELPTFFPNLER